MTVTVKANAKVKVKAKGRWRDECRREGECAAKGYVCMYS